MDVTELQRSTGMSLRQIAKHAGISRTTLYNLIKNKHVRRSTAEKIVNGLLNTRGLFSAQQNIELSSYARAIGLNIRVNNRDIEVIRNSIDDRHRDMKRYLDTSNKEKYLTAIGEWEELKSKIDECINDTKALGRLRRVL
ncbi:helix-turn-helix domain-containing protein [Aquibium oceanicum]|uniref:hypothetical protein n=1 Tax=Aquibium oceanicum TaxID=1670800 RepID=UPI0012FFD155|nr:hypothetical protein [Aquibium oceanicum]